MVGVTSPLIRNGKTRDGVALFGWYVMGTAFAGSIVFTGLSIISLGVSAVLPAGARYLLLAFCVGVLLVLDVFGKTPHVSRQTAQRLVDLPPSVRGFAWGLDIGLLFTTIKVTSLVWVLLLLSVAYPRHALVAVFAFYVAYLLTESVATIFDIALGSARVFSRLQGRWFRRAARAVSVTLLLPVIVIAVTRGL